MDTGQSASQVRDALSLVPHRSPVTHPVFPQKSIQKAFVFEGMNASYAMKGRVITFILAAFTKG